MEKKEVPVFVKIDDYKDILDIINLAKEKLQLAKNSLAKIKSLKEQEEKKIQVWQDELMDVEGKLNDIDETLLEPQVQ